MDIVKGLCIRERTCYAFITHLDTKASEQQEEGKVHFYTGVVDASKEYCEKCVFLRLSSVKYPVENIPFPAITICEPETERPEEYAR